MLQRVLLETMAPMVLGLEAFPVLYTTCMGSRWESLFGDSELGVLTHLAVFAAEAPDGSFSVLNSDGMS